MQSAHLERHTFGTCARLNVSHHPDSDGGCAVCNGLVIDRLVVVGPGVVVVHAYFCGHALAAYLPHAWCWQRRLCRGSEWHALSCGHGHLPLFLATYPWLAKGDECCVGSRHLARHGVVEASARHPRQWDFFGRGDPNAVWKRPVVIQRCQAWQPVFYCVACQSH